VTDLARHTASTARADPSDVRGPLPDALWRDLVAGSPEVTIIADYDLVCRFASDSILEMSGYSPEDIRDVPLARIVHRGDWDRVLRAHRDLDEGAPLAELDVRVRFVDGEWHDVNVRVRRIERAEEIWIILTARDVTVDRANAAALLRKIELERQLEKIQRRFIHTDEFDEAIQWALREVGTFLGADRAYLLSYDLEARTESMTHEWTAPGTPPSIEEYQDISFDLVPIGIDRSLAGEVLAIPDVAALDGTWSADREFLLAEGIQSLLEFPIVVGGRTRASLGFDWTSSKATWTHDDLVGIGMFAATFGQIMTRRDAETAMARTVDELRMGFEGSPVPLALLDTDGTLLRVNSELCRLTGRTSDELIGARARSLVDPQDHPAIEAWMSQITSWEDIATSRLEVRLDLDEVRWVEITFRPTAVEQGEPVYAVARFDDITAVKEAQAALNESEARFQTLVDNLPDPVMRVGRHGEALFANQAARATLIPRDDGHFVVEPTVAELLRTKRELAFATGEIQLAQYEVETIGGRRYLETRFVPEPSPDGFSRSLLLVSADLTQRRRSEEELAFRATHDSLTGLPNRVAFLSRLDEALARRSRDALVAVLFFDLDRFKVVNDSLGHAMGDELLVAIAERLHGALRPGDVVARLGGDEFTILVDNAPDLAAVLGVAHRVAEVLAEPIDVGGRPIVVSCSIGVALATGAETSAQLLQHADAAMYRAKDSGRNRIALFDETLAAEVQGRLELDQRLRRAVEADEFEVHYQPEVDLRSGRILGCEALLRWRKDGQLVSAAEFIDLAEETGLIIQIGAWVLEEACRSAADWVGDLPPGAEFTLRVNLSARQLEDNLIRTVSEVLARTGLPARHLCLEITETALMADAATSRDLLRSLAGLGVTLAVDDFGTGYSSLSYLRQFPVSVLKIDRSFVQGLADEDGKSSGGDTAIVETIIRLADSLGMEVTAEGVETSAHADRLTQLGCSRGQGFLYARPMPAVEFSRRLEVGR
jgi:diguanylate cyclase (GGDEF)-like protein/PAS domain S-box-containing protein